MHSCILIPGDGIGPEVTGAAVKTIQAASADIEFIEVGIGQSAYERYGDIVPLEVIEKIRKAKTVLKGPVSTPIGAGIPSANRKLRRTLDLFASIRIANPLGTPSKVLEKGLVVIMDNMEGAAANIQNFLDQDETVGVSILVSTMKNVRRLTEYAFEYCMEKDRRKLTLVTLADHFKFTDGMWLKAARETRDRFPDLQYEELLADNATCRLVQKPSDFDVILTNDIWGETLCSLCAGLVGGTGITPVINTGSDVVMFETIHGAAPDIAGKNIANPTASIYGGALLLRHLGKNREAEAIENALKSVIREGRILTFDLGGNATTTQFTREVVARLGQEL